MQVTLDTFLSKAFATRQPNEKVALGLAYPGNRGFRPKGWTPGVQVLARGLHFNCATFKPEASRATVDNTARVHVVMLDDVGNLEGKSKASLDRMLKLPEEVRPHSVIATRRVGEHFNAQACWFIRPVGHEMGRAFIRAAAMGGWGDPDCSGGMRWARPPGSIKQDGNGYAATVEYDRLDAPRVEIGALAFALGLPESWREEINARRATRSSNAAAPFAGLVRSAMAVLVNDFGREDWVRIGLALKACVGPSPALSDASASALFDEFSRQHPSYRPRDTQQAWNTFAPNGSISFDTIAWHASQRGWRDVDYWQQRFEQQEKEAQRMGVDQLIAAMVRAEKPGTGTASDNISAGG